MELRDIEIFLTLSEELHFGRTAERLHISQARVSQSIAKQERRIGAALFERSSRRVRLTAIGQQLHQDLKVGYQHILDATESAVAAARGTTGTLTLGTMGAMAHEIADVTGLFRARHPASELRFKEIPGTDPFGPLRSGATDIELLWLPIREPDLTVGPVLRARPLILMVGDTHPLAERESVSMEDLGDCITLGPEPSSPMPDYWFDAIVPRRTPAGRPIQREVRAQTWQGTLSDIATGEVVLPMTAEAATYFPWPGIVYLPIRDAPLAEWALVWRTAGESPLIRAFTRAAQDTLDHDGNPQTAHSTDNT